MTSDRYQFVLTTIQKAGELLLAVAKKNVTIGIKNNDRHEIVTNVDIAISEFITQEIQKKFPGEIIYSEEAPNVDVSSGSYWSIDPIDGTANFARSIPHFSVVTTYVDHGISIAGAIFNPLTQELFSFEK